MKRNLLSLFVLLAGIAVSHAQDLMLNDLEYFERQGVNVLVFSNSFNGGFNDEKNSGIEIIHHGVRTVQGGAVRLNTWSSPAHRGTASRRGQKKMQAAFFRKRPAFHISQISHIVREG